MHFSTCTSAYAIPQVDQHCFKCRECWFLSCIDCGKRFEGDAYKQHTSCISEAQKYQGHLYKSSQVAVSRFLTMSSNNRNASSIKIIYNSLAQSMQKKATAQELWVQSAQKTATDGLVKDPKLSDLLQGILVGHLAFSQQFSPRQ